MGKFTQHAAEVCSSRDYCPIVHVSVGTGRHTFVMDRRISFSMGLLDGHRQLTSNDGQEQAFN